MDLLESQKYIIGEIKEEDLSNVLNELLNEYLFKIEKFDFSKKYERELETYNMIIEIFINQLKILLNNKEDSCEIIKTSIFLGVLLESIFQFFLLVYEKDYEKYYKKHYKKHNKIEIKDLGIANIKEFLKKDKVFSTDNVTDDSIINTIESIRKNRNIVHVFNDWYDIVYDELISNVKKFYYILDDLDGRISYKFEELQEMAVGNC